MTLGTMERIQTVTVPAGGQVAIEFLNIAQTYDDLYIVFSLRSNRSSEVDNINLRFNGSTSNLSSRRLVGNGSTAASFSYASNIYIEAAGNTATSNTFGNGSIYIPNYRGSTNKSVSSNEVTENNATGASQMFVAGLWSNTAAITSIQLPVLDGTLWLQHSTATLYGITRVPAGAKATGGVIYDDSSYWYHVFTSSGTFTPLQNITCDYLVVAGGGAGGAADSQNYSGGGGAGGLRCTVGTTGGGGSLESPLSLTASSNYTVTIGAGGAASSSSWSSGNNSVFSTITSTGGGAGGGINITPAWVQALSGGSGGGGDEAVTAGAAGTANQGYAGGTANSVPAFQGSQGAGGGGGGAGAVGSNGVSSTGGAGGAGVATSISGTSITYAGGGGGSGGIAGGAGGTGGGGAGSSGTPTAGTANTGGGGGSGNRSGAAGGSGIVIVRYAK